MVIGLCRNNGQPEELGGCDLRVEFARLVKLYKLERKKNKLTKTNTRCLAIILTQMYPLFRE